MATDISFENLFDTQQKKLAFYQNILIVALADRHINEMEGDFMYSIREQLNLSEKDTQPIIQNLSSLSFILPEDSRQKITELRTLVQLMLQDGEIEPREYNMCLDFTIKIGYNKEILDELIQTFSPR